MTRRAVPSGAIGAANDKAFIGSVDGAGVPSDLTKFEGQFAAFYVCDVCGFGLRSDIDRIQSSVHCVSPHGKNDSFVPHTTAF